MTPNSPFADRLWAMSLFAKKNSLRSGIGMYSLSFLLLPLLFLSTRAAKESEPVTGDITTAALMMDPVVTARFANPVYDCDEMEYCLDAQFQCNQSNKEIFGLNFRFWYDDDVLEYSHLTNFVGGYGNTSCQPSPPQIATAPSLGPSWFNFTGAAEWHNGCMEKENGNAPPVYLPTSGWTTLFSVCFTVDGFVPSETNFCPAVIWDLEQDPADGGFIQGSDGLVISMIGGTGYSTENVNQFNWEYIGSGDPPFGQPIEQHCIDADCAGGGGCDLVVVSTGDSGAGTLREALTCADPGSIITFASALSGATINITSTRLLINKDVDIINNNTNPVTIQSNIGGLFEVSTAGITHLKKVNLKSGNNDVGGAAIKNYGNVILENVNVIRNPNLPGTHPLVKNFANSDLILKGVCSIQD